MNTYNFELVRKSWTIISKIDYEVVCGTFYIRLFQISPELKVLFRNTSMTEQSVKLGCMLSYVISKYESMEDVMVEVKALAERHKKYGAKEEHYNDIGEALLWTLQQGLGEYWNPALGNAWKEFYETLSDQMKEVSRAV